MKKYQIKAFTLVELIIVITILAILATIGFMSFQSYTSDARDTNRVTSLGEIKKGFDLYQLRKSNLPLPTNYVTITASGAPIGYQGIFGKTESDLIKMTSLPLDPLDNTGYIYNVNSSKNKFQLLTYLENQTAYNSNLNEVYARDYSNRKIYTIGDTLGIILNTDNSNVNNNTLDIVNNNNVYKAIIDNTYSGTITGTGNVLKTLSVVSDSDSSFATSCNDIKSKNLDFKGNGTYWINPTGNLSFQVYCNMIVDGGGWIMIAKNYGTRSLLRQETCNTNTLCNGGINPNLQSLLSNNNTQIISIDGNNNKVLSFTVTDINHTFMKALKGELITNYTHTSITGAISNVSYNPNYQIIDGTYLQSYFTYNSSGSQFLICQGPGGCSEGPLFSIGWSNYSGYYVPPTGSITGNVTDNNLYGGVYIK